MKRLLLLTLLLLPFGAASVQQVVDCSRPDRVHLAPRFMEAGVDPHRARSDPDAGFPTDGGLVRTEVKGLPMATPDRATDDARRTAEALVGTRLHERFGTPSGWSPPRALLDRTIELGPLETVEHDYGTVHTRTLRIDASETNLRILASAHERELAARRLGLLGGGIGFLLVCLATINGYIRADEATRGYHTRALQAASLVAIGASGAAIYSWLS